MTKKIKLVRKIGLTSGFALTMALAAWWSMAAQAADKKHADHATHGSQAQALNHIQTQAEAEALKPGDSVAMVCSMCKHVMIHPVTKDKSHVQLMTVGHKHMCAVCGGTVTVVGTGRGKGKHEKVKHVCSKCGDDAMFVCASKPNNVSQDHHDHDQK